MKSITMLFALVVFTALPAIGQESINSKRINEFGLGTNNFQNFTITYKNGNLNGWYFRARAFGIDWHVNKSGTDTLKKTNSYLNIGVTVGYEKRFYLNPHISLGVGLDLITTYNTENSFDINEELDKKGVKLGFGAGVPLSANYQFADHRLMFSFEFTPYFIQNRYVSKEYNDGEVVDGSTQKASTSDIIFFDYSNVLLTLSYRLFK